ncbi:c3hc4 type (ring finger) zinc finger containing protein [Moniliophthora roreri]|nr:c3hc4 type (ring finger) zinc finger containing protein [Moniliophthora roreri]
MSQALSPQRPSRFPETAPDSSIWQSIRKGNRKHFGRQEAKSEIQTIRHSGILPDLQTIGAHFWSSERSRSASISEFGVES